MNFDSFSKVESVNFDSLIFHASLFRLLQNSVYVDIAQASEVANPRTVDYLNKLILDNRDACIDILNYFVEVGHDRERIKKLLDYRLQQLSKNKLFERGKISVGDAGISWESVGETFDWICHICGERTNRLAGTPKNQRGCTVDHVVPQVRGGANTWNNVLPAHFVCNIKKRDRI
jgi:hypothetical protein